MRASENSSAAKNASSNHAPRSASICTPDRFRLAGPSRLDRRVNAVRGDIADLALAGTLFAPHYARPLIRACTAPSAMLRGSPSAAAGGVSQLLSGESFAVIDLTGGWAWGYSDHDHYVGYVEAAHLGDPIEATHIVTTRSTLVFSEPDPRSAVIAALSMGARIVAAGDDSFLKVEGGFVPKRHIVPIGTAEADPVALAERLIGIPYLWGGRGANGIDCSGLVQLTLGLTGVSVPRDSDLQRDAVGRPVPDGAPLARGDLIFFPEHVAMMLDPDRVIHANSHFMAVAVEPLADLVARAGPPIARRRVAA